VKIKLKRREKSRNWISSKKEKWFMVRENIKEKWRPHFNFWKICLEELFSVSIKGNNKRTRSLYTKTRQYDDHKKLTEKCGLQHQKKRYCCIFSFQGRS
jgi:hypothetical protein